MNLRRECEALSYAVAFTFPWVALVFKRGTVIPLLFVMGLLLALRLFAERRRLKEALAPLARRAVWVPLLVGVAVTGGGIFFSPAPGEAFEYWISVVALVPALALFCAMEADRPPARLDLAFILGFVTALLLLAIQFGLGFSFVQEVSSGEAEYFWPVTLGRGTVILAFAYFPLLMALDRFVGDLRVRGISKAALTVVLFFFAWIGLNDTVRVAFPLALVACGAALVLPTRLCAKLVLAGIGVGLLAFPFIFSQIDAFMPTSVRHWDQASAGARLEIWRAVTEKVLAAPVTGYGFSGSRFIDFGERPENVFMPKHMILQHPHNGLLQVWLDLGGVGVLALLCGMFFAYRKIAAGPLSLQRAEVGLIVTIFFVYLTGYGLWQQWLIVAAVLAFFYARLFARGLAGTPT